MAMSFEALQPNLARRFFWLFLLLHTILWTLGPWLTRSSLPHDTLESITWGLQWQWGYNKHPFLAAWISAAMHHLYGASDLPIYFLAQLVVTATFILTWQFARKLLPPVHAIIAALVLDGVLYYNINSFNLTPDTLQSPLWVLLVLCFYQATKNGSITGWIATGIVAGLCILTKYQVAMLLVPMTLFCFTNPAARACFFSPGIYLAAGLILLVISPHLIWLWQNDFQTIRYALGAPYGDARQYAHTICLLRYLGDCIAYTAGLFLLFWPFYRTKKATEFTLTGFDRQFLLFTGLGPCLLTAIFCFVHGDLIPSRWSTPYFSLLGVLMMTWLKPGLTPRGLKRFAITLIGVSGLLWGGRMMTIMSHSNMKSDAYLPNQAIAARLNQLWQQHYATPLRYVGGAHYLVGLTVPYFADEPIPYFSLDPKENPWLDEQDLRQHGGIIVWDAGMNYFWDAYSPTFESLPVDIQQRFPDLKMLGTYTFYRNTPGRLPVVIGVALLPPH